MGGNSSTLAPAPGWRHLAACLGSDPGLFFGPEDETAWSSASRESKAKRVCAACPVRPACLRDAEASGDIYGVWGGEGEQDRHRATPDPSLCREQQHPKTPENTGARGCLPCERGKDAARRAQARLSRPPGPGSGSNAADRERDAGGRLVAAQAA